LTKTLDRQSPDFIGMQEVLKRQLDYLLENLPEYRSIGVGRDNGKEGGEFVPVLYQYERFRLLDDGTFWLSPTPADTASVGWDAALTRICTWGKFLEINTGKEIFFLNTHFDHMGKTARAESARLILDFIEKETTGLPVILTGDFNCSPDEEPYRILADDKKGLQDACLSVNSPESCTEGTFNGFETTENLPRIDMVFVKGNWEVNSYEILRIKRGKMFISDHFPVVVGLNLKD
jgi:endonuclease/exonuclease/phosphatase family metal-dependent hydrolase